MTTLQEIVTTDFGGNIPTKEEIITKFPPKTEELGANNFREVSRASNGVIVYIAPPKEA